MRPLLKWLYPVCLSDGLQKTHIKTERFTQNSKKGRRRQPFLLGIIEYVSAYTSPDEISRLILPSLISMILSAFWAIFLSCVIMIKVVLNFSLISRRMS